MACSAPAAATTKCNTSLNSPSATTGRKRLLSRWFGRTAKRVISTTLAERSAGGSAKYSSASSGPAARGVTRIEPTASPVRTSSARRSQERPSYSSGIGTS